MLYIIFSTASKPYWIKTFEIARLGIGRTFQVVKPLKRLTVEENVMAAAFARESSFAGAKKVAKEIDKLNFSSTSLNNNFYNN